MTEKEHNLETADSSPQNDENAAQVEATSSHEDESTPEDEVAPNDESTDKDESTPETEVATVDESTPEDEVAPNDESTDQDESTPETEFATVDESTTEDESPSGDESKNGDEIISSDESTPDVEPATDEASSEDESAPADESVPVEALLKDVEPAEEAAPETEAVSSDEKAAPEIEATPSDESEPAEEAASEEASQADEPRTKAGMSWFVLRVASNKEDYVRAALEKKVQIEGVQHLVGSIMVPTEKTKTLTKSNKVKITETKLYPGYIFVEMKLVDSRISQDVFFLIKETTGVGDFVGTAGKPTPMSNEEVDKMLYDSQAPDEVTEVKLEFVKGDHVNVKEGPFMGYEGTVDDIFPEKGVVRLLATVFGRQTQIDIEYWMIEKAE